MNYSQKDIILVPFPYSNLSGYKKRPAIIISNQKMQNSEDIICCLITSHSPKDGILIEENYFEEGSLPFKSWIKPYRIFTVEKNEIIKKLARVNSSSYKLIFESVCNYIK